MEKYYLAFENGIPYCFQFGHKLILLGNMTPELFWGEDTRQEEFYDLSEGVKLWDVYSCFHGDKVRVVGTII